MKLRTAASWVLVLLAISFTCLHNVSAQPGWVSIDCGAPAPYVDDKGVSWVPDDAYVTGGSTATVALDPSVPYATGQALTTLRYFPDSSKTRYCYTVPTKKSQLYVARWTAYHGGYDANPAVKFDLAFDLFGISTIAYTAAVPLQIGEGIFRTVKESVQLCLFRTGPGDNPFMSALELRPLDNTMYPAAVDDTLLSFETRANCGPVSGQLLRYPEDPYDRFWFGYSNAPIYSTLTVASVKDTGFAMDKPPAAVMNSAVTTAVGATSISLEIYPAVRNVSFVMNVYLAELEILTAGQTRVFDVLVNGVLSTPNVNVYSSAHNAVYKPIEFTYNGSIPLTGSLGVKLTSAATSTFGPIINALEILSVYSNEPGTFAADGVAIGSVKKDLGLLSWTGDPCLMKPYDWLQCTSNSPPRVTAVTLSKYNLTGSIPVGVRDLTEVTILSLDNNKLTGPIPEWLASLPNLKELYLQNNDLSGNVPKSLLSNPLLKLRIDGNPRLCVNTTTCATDQKSSNVGVVAGVVVGVLLVVGIAVGVTVYCFCVKKKTTNTKDSLEEGDGTTTRGSRYTLAQVMAATKNHQKVLGKGGFGPVYYGKLASGQEVAVKVAAKGSNQGSKEFINEVELLTRVHHKNLVSLVGYCDEGDNLILLYEYMPLGTIQEHLYGVGINERAFFLDWPTRLQVAVQAAQGLEYLHVGCSPAIFHRDVKSNNILLGDKMIAKVADFGLSKSTNSKEKVTHVSTMVKGTIGYLDPEYFNTNQLTEKSDVYGFGIVLLELICARPPFVPDLPEDQRRIDHWVRPRLQAGNIEKIVDPTLDGQYNLECMWRVAELAIQSVEPRGVHRPKMSFIVQELREALQLEKSSPSVPAVNKPDQQGFQFDVMPHSSNGRDSDVLFSSDNSAPFLQPPLSR